MYKKLLFLFFINCFVYCKNNNSNQIDHQDSISNNNSFDPDGTYVNSDYEDRNEGKDWVGIEVTSLEDKLISLSIRSRADLKRPTCTLHCLAKKKNDSTYVAIETDLPIQFMFTRDRLFVSSKTSEGLAYFCSGGASIGGDYRYIKGSLDTAQVDPRIFSKYLHREGINFEISVEIIDDKKILQVTPMGLAKDNSTFYKSLDMNIVSAQTTDLNNDKDPELVIILKNFKTKKSKVLVFTTNHKKSMSLVNFPYNSFKLDEGNYRGNDIYDIKNNKLIRSFPIFKNGKITGNEYKIIYKLVPGEAMAQFKIESQQTIQAN
ncbi:hypothetical protein [Zunongwangia endophytica]|uniref:Uncharacterized protein n=1 Tax=Zunongwangia endophytica TaxID=1808945 RepID=A0ABV8HAM8_9FLAO|nr:hypothetical protein [Zunongwangia endophytica]MDN3594681.1 hypothetical protein [Zunongwangia endophytica]